MHEISFQEYYNSTSPSPLNDLPPWDDHSLLYDDDFVPVITGSRRQESLDIFGGSMDFVSTTSQKHSLLNNHASMDSWKTKQLKHWETYDIMCWLIAVSKRHSFDYESMKMERFRMDGNQLCHMSKSEIIDCEPKYGHIIYSELQGLQGNTYHELIPSYVDLLPAFHTLRGSFEQNLLSVSDELDSCHPLLDVRQEDVMLSYPLSSDSDTETQHDTKVVTPDTKSEDPETKPKRKGGRPKGVKKMRKSGRRTDKKCGRLWEFVRDLLKNPEYCPSLICWENPDEGVFRFVRSEKVAALWGDIKENPKMTYEKLSRAMRYYYKSKVLQPVLGRRLVYRFGPNATNWRPTNPNFR